MVHLALSLMPTEDYRAAAFPLFEAGLVDALEWSLDLAWLPAGGLPAATRAWVDPLLDHFADAGRLHGHGVTYSPLSARWEPRQADWLARAAAECERRAYQTLSEHFGFLTAPGYRDGAPLPVPFCDQAVAIGRDRLARLRAACGVPVGLENLAMALCPRDVDDQGPFLEALLEPDGFLLLDLHNLYCQAVNFERDPLALMETYPLDRVRTIHVSGGSWWETPAGQRIRRDTHDDVTPDAVLDLLRPALARCGNAELVVVERLGGTLRDPAGPPAFRAEVERVRARIL